MKTKFLVHSTLVFLVGVTKTVSAQGIHPALNDTHSFMIGSYAQTSNSSIAASVERSRSQSIDLDDLGVDENFTITTRVLGLIQMLCPLTPTAKNDASRRPARPSVDEGHGTPALANTPRRTV